MLTFRRIYFCLRFINYVYTNFHEIHVKAVKNICCEKILRHVLFDVLISHKALLSAFMQQISYVVDVSGVICRIAFFAAIAFYCLNFGNAVIIFLADDLDIFIQICTVRSIKQFILYDHRITNVSLFRI
ncbi:hypothetical protein SDC9_212881 [bioreactor metagenome]|uniref:Uncharacterized protein n=1 Tax=bioreactor metagenome TaxID=1076179 RepID=A0A645JP74_9ZZZZ